MTLAEIVEELEKLKGALAAVQQEDDARRIRIRHIAHDGRGMLSRIVGLNQLKDTLDFDQFKEMVASVADNADMLISLVDSLWSDTNNKVERFNLSKIAESVARFVQDGNKKTPVLPIRVISSPSELVVISDQLKVVRILTNLITNAYKNTTTSVAVELKRMDYSISIEVSNPGPRVSPEKASTMFDVEKTLLSKDGHGIGLKIVKSVSQELGGDVEYGYEDGLNVFTVTFPVIG